jgi:hypothetical protein
MQKREKIRSRESSSKEKEKEKKRELFGDALEERTSLPIPLY